LQKASMTVAWNRALELWQGGEIQFGFGEGRRETAALVLERKRPQCVGVDRGTSKGDKKLILAKKPISSVVEKKEVLLTKKPSRSYGEGRVQSCP